MMNLDALVAVETANSKATTSSKPKASKESFSLRKGVTKKGVTMFTITPKFFEAQGLANNSLKQFESAEGIALVVTPGNSGVFLKNTAKGNKGRAFKNDKLAASIATHGLEAKFYELDYVGDKDGAKYFAIRPVRKDVAPEATDASTEVVAENAVQG